MIKRTPSKNIRVLSTTVYNSDFAINLAIKTTAHFEKFAVFHLAIKLKIDVKFHDQTYVRVQMKIKNIIDFPKTKLVLRYILFQNNRK